MTKLKLHRVDDAITGVALSLELPDLPACSSSGADHACLQRDVVMGTLLWSTGDTLRGGLHVEVEVQTAAPEADRSAKSIAFHEKVRVDTIALLQKSFGNDLGMPLVSRASLPDGVGVVLAEADGHAYRVIHHHMPSWDFDLKCEVSQTSTEPIRNLQASLAWAAKVCSSVTRR